MTRSGVPVAWPAVCVVDTDPFRIRLTTSIALPRKALNVRRDPRVALLFSDPTGSGRTDLPQVLVQGTATCPEDIHTSPAGMERYWSQLADRQPSSRSYASSAISRALFDFYYMRLVITVTPEAVTLAPPLVRATAPKAIRRRRGDTPAGDLARRLAGYPDAVLATAAEGALPDLRRVRVAAQGAAFVLSPVPGDPRPLPRGRAQLLLHSHDERIQELRQVAAMGAVEGDDDRPTFALERLITSTDASTPLATLSIVRRIRRTTRRYLEQRSLPRPRIAWEEFRRLVERPRA